MEGTKAAEERERIHAEKVAEQELRQDEKNTAFGSGTSSLFCMTNIDENLLMWLLFLKMARTPEGMKHVKDILMETVKAAFESLSDYCRAGATNRIAAWGSGMMLNNVLERLGLLTQAQGTNFSVGISLITGSEVAEEWTALLPWNALKADIDFPTHIHLGDKTRTVVVERKK